MRDLEPVAELGVTSQARDYLLVPPNVTSETSIGALFCDVIDTRERKIIRVIDACHPHFRSATGCDFILFY